MNKNLIISLITGAVVVGGVIWYFNSNFSNSVSSYTPPVAESTNMPAMPPMTPPAPQTAEPGMPPAASANINVSVGKVSVAISNFAYDPANLTVKKGATVTWTNYDSVKHDIVSDSGTTLSSPYLATNESWSYTFNVVGTFSYHCIPHPWMKGTVTVVQ